MTPDIQPYLAAIEAAERELADCQRRVGRAYCKGQEDALRRAREALGRAVYEWAKGEAQS